MDDPFQPPSPHGNAARCLNGRHGGSSGLLRWWLRRWVAWARRRLGQLAWRRARYLRQSLRWPRRVLDPHIRIRRRDRWPRSRNNARLRRSWRVFNPRLRLYLVLLLLCPLHNLVVHLRRMIRLILLLLQQFLVRRLLLRLLGRRLWRRCRRCLHLDRPGSRLRGGRTSGRCFLHRLFRGYGRWSRLRRQRGGSRALGSNIHTSQHGRRKRETSGAKKQCHRDHLHSRMLASLLRFAPQG